ncbi:phage tail tape measure protein [Serratia sp. M24T3]|uniref:phage tail tape measure protein n=1 Tax=Serratia sp. M24T3 TaxID=932213 RepID=UPI0002E3F6E2|nr:phage tail tape measure protein [Serratia sp. M24T3]
MASKSLGTLTLDLIAKVGGFVAGMSEAERSSAKWRKEVEKNAKAVGTAIGATTVAITAAAVGAGLAALNITKNVAESVVETDRWAKSLGISTTELQKWQYAATQAGLSGDNIADIFKDLNDKIGDAVLNKSGEAAQALDTLGLSAKKLQNVSPDKQLLAISAAMKGMNVAQKTTIFEALGNDLSKMIPLLDNGAQKLNQLKQKATDKGLALPQGDIDKLLVFNNFIQDIGVSVDGVKNKIAVGLANANLDPLKKALDDTFNIVTSPEVLQGLVNLVTQASNLAGWLIKGAGALGDFAKLAGIKVAEFGGNIDLNNIDQVTARMKVLQKQIDDTNNDSNDFRRGIESFLTGKDFSVGKATDELKKLRSVRSSLLKPVTIPTGLAVLDPKIAVPTDFKLGNGEHNQKQTAKKQAKDPLVSAYEDRMNALKRAAALVDTTGKKESDVTELQKINYDILEGKLSKLNETQKENLKLAAKELDAKNALKKANEDNLAVQEFASNLGKENKNVKQGLNVEFVGAGMGSEAKARLQELVSVQQDFQDKQADLQSQHNKGEISSSRYDDETKELSKALEVRLKIYKKHWEDQDKLKDDWQSGALDSLKDYMNSAQNYNQQAADAVAGVLQSATSSLADNITNVITGTESLSDAFVNVGQTILNSIVSALAQMAAQWLINQALMAVIGNASVTQSTTQATATANAWAPAATAASIASFGGAAVAGTLANAAAMIAGKSLFGMAHDGVDSVPQTGTWLLQKGERVTTANTSAKLDATLERVSKSSTGGGGNTYSPTIPISINGNPSDATIALTRKAAEQGAIKGYNMVTRDLQKGTGNVHASITSKYDTKRRAK